MSYPSGPINRIDYLPDNSITVCEDHHGFMMSVLSPGSHIRAAASAVQEGIFNEISHISARSVICICVGEQANIVAQLLSSALNSLLSCPFVIAEELPQWFGPLDLIVILSDTADARLAYKAIDLASRRSGVIVLDAPYNSPLVDIAKTYSGIIIAPSIYRPIGISADLLCLWRHIGVLLAVLMQLNSSIANKIGPLDVLADRLDQTALQVGPQSDESTNPALALVLQMQGHDCIWIYDSATTRVIAHYAQYIFRTIGALSTAALPLSGWCQRLVLQPERSVERDIFYDPSFDEDPYKPIRGFIIAAHGRSASNRSFAEPAGDVRVILDITSRPSNADVDALDGLFSILVYIEVAAVIFSRQYYYQC